MTARSGGPCARPTRSCSRWSASCRARPDPEATDIASLLCRARDEHGQRLSDQRVRDDIIAMFAAGTETTAVALTWLWVVAARAPRGGPAPGPGGRRGRSGRGRRRPEHLPRLRYARMVFSELLRLYPIGWVIPRTAVADDVIDGVRVHGGGTVILSPYLTQRRPDLWRDPDRFDPERFAPAASTSGPGSPTSPSAAAPTPAWADICPLWRHSSSPPPCWPGSGPRVRGDPPRAPRRRVAAAGPAGRVRPASGAGQSGQ